MPTYIVLGMHRSGTSAVAGMLDRLGVRMGPKKARPDWVGRHWSNPMGHFENPDVVWLNGRILGYDGTGVHESPRWDEIPERARRWAPEIDRILRATEGGVWGWKDPWSVLTIEEFLPQVRDPRFIFVFRDPLQVAQSLFRRDGTGPEESQRIAARFATQLAKISARHPEIPRLELQFEEITHHPSETVARLAEFAGLHPSPEERRAAEALIVDEASLRLLARHMAWWGLATYPKWLAWLLARDLRLGRHSVPALWRNASQELIGAFRTVI
ncbi:MAG: sulfotransferase [Thermoplasmata archaeon]|nr:sulfotransferase [Thermoplasmata archaeon]